jgi:hypothetical protein
MELNKAWRAIRDRATSQASELSAAPDTDVQPFSVEADQGAAATTPLSDNSAGGEHPPGPTSAQEREGDAP